MRPRMLLQKLPDQTAGDADAWPRVIQLADTLRGDELIQLPKEELLHRLFHEEDVRWFDEQPVSFHCTCSCGNVAQMLRMLGVGEVEAILTERQTIEMQSSAITATNSIRSMRHSCFPRPLRLRAVKLAISAPTIFSRLESGSAGTGFLVSG